MKIAVIHGPNLRTLGRREPHVYGTVTLPQVDQDLRELASELDVELEIFQSNHEGEILDFLEEVREEVRGILVNPAGLTHTSVSLLDALLAADLPAVEVHLSNPAAREDFRHRSFTARACLGTVAGFGKNSYLLGLRALVAHLQHPSRAG
jgi:3-dehydroquinate dehydratase-2